MNELILVRISQNPKQTLSFLLVVGNNLEILSHYVALELPFLDNKKNISSIPVGTYSCAIEVHARYGKCIRVSGVFGRSGILIHVGNFHYQTSGCILVGQRFRDVDKDGNLDVVNSRVSLNDIYDSLPAQFSLKVI